MREKHKLAYTSCLDGLMEELKHGAPNPGCSYCPDSLRAAMTRLKRLEAVAVAADGLVNCDGSAVEAERSFRKRWLAVKEALAALDSPAEAPAEGDPSLLVNILGDDDGDS